MSFIEMKNVCKRYAGAEKNSVTDFNLSIEKGEFIAFVGPTFGMRKIDDAQNDSRI